MFNFSNFLPFLMPLFKVKIFCGVDSETFFTRIVFPGLILSPGMILFFRWIGLAGFDNLVRVD